MHFEGTHSIIKVAFQWRYLGIWCSCSSPSGYVLAVCYKVVGLILTLPEARLWSRCSSCKTWMYFPSSAQQPLSPPTLMLGLLSSIMPWPSLLAHFLLLCNPSWHITSTPSDIKYYLSLDWASQNLPASAGDMRDSSSIPGLGRSPGEEDMANYSSILAWRIPWTEEPGGLQSMRAQRAQHDWSDLACMYPWVLLLTLVSTHTLWISWWKLLSLCWLGYISPRSAPGLSLECLHLNVPRACQSLHAWVVIPTLTPVFAPVFPDYCMALPFTQVPWPAPGLPPSRLLLLLSPKPLKLLFFLSLF